MTCLSTTKMIPAVKWHTLLIPVFVQCFTPQIIRVNGTNITLLLSNIFKPRLKRICFVTASVFSFSSVFSADTSKRAIHHT